MKYPFHFRSRRKEAQVSKGLVLDQSLVTSAATILRRALFGATLLLATAGSALAEVHYVDVNSTNATPPYTNWTTAATNIQDAVDAAVAGDEIVVTNGLYAPVAVNKPLNVRSVNGREATFIYGLGAYRCASLASGASLSGFTLFGGSVHVPYTGQPSYGGGAIGGTLNNCTLRDNQTLGSDNGKAYGGGAYGCTLNNCTLTDNSALNFNTSGSASGGGAYACTLNNCTLSYNQASAAFGSSGGGAAYSTLKNCIVYSNTAGSGENYAGGTINYCCTTPLPGGIGNITNAPLFVDAAAGNLRLQSNSPCINAGNNPYATNASDLDGNPRIAGGTVDIGAYEFQSPASMISYAWLQQFDLPINPATDTADPDGDGVDNYHEWLAGTDPTNPLSSPAQLTIIPSGANVILTWSTNAVGFTLQSTTNLVSPAVWSTNSPALVVIGGQNVVISPRSGPRQFYPVEPLIKQVIIRL